MTGNFWMHVIVANRWRYLLVTAACFVYAFGIPLTGPKWYRAEATLAFKNRTDQQQIDLTRLSTNPLPIFMDETPVERQYDITDILYSVNMANRVLGDRLDEIYDPDEYDSLTDFYNKFLMQLGCEYDGEKNIVHLSYTYKDPVLAAEFCNGFAQGLEDFMVEVVENSNTSPSLRARLEAARRKAAEAEAEVNRISELYNVPNLLEAPKEWVKAYAQALERSYIGEVEMRAVLAALRQMRENREMQNLSGRQQSPPDTTIVKDVILGALRLRLAMVNAEMAAIDESLPEGSSARKRLESESEFLNEYIRQQYALGLDVESNTLLMKLQEDIVRNYMYQARVDMTYTRLQQLPELERAVRPSIRAANVANATVTTLDKLISLLEIGEEYGVRPVRVVDAAIVPMRPVQPSWKILGYILPTMLFASTLWFALSCQISSENSCLPASLNNDETQKE